MRTAETTISKTRSSSRPMPAASISSTIGSSIVVPGAVASRCRDAAVLSAAGRHAGVGPAGRSSGDAGHPAVEGRALLERAAERLDERPEVVLLHASGRASAPAAREMFSSISVPPRSLTPACSTWRTPATPIFTHEAWMLSMRPW